MKTSSTTGLKCRRSAWSAASRRGLGRYLADVDLGIPENHRLAGDHDEKKKDHRRHQKRCQEGQENAPKREPIRCQWTPPQPDTQLPPVPVKAISNHGEPL
jgi:hypothetical protein